MLMTAGGGFGAGGDLIFGIGGGCFAIVLGDGDGETRVGGGGEEHWNQMRRYLTTPDEGVSYYHDMR